MSEDAIYRALAVLTPPKLAGMMEELSLTQPVNQRDSVPLLSIMGASKGDTNFVGRVGWSIYVRLRQAIIAGVADIGEMRFVEGDS